MTIRDDALTSESRRRLWQACRLRLRNSSVWRRDDFCDTFKHHLATAQWTHQDLNRQTKIRVAPTLKFVRSTS